MRILADLHLHTTASDGVLTPHELADCVHTFGITHLAITDHDNLDGIPVMREAVEAYGMILISGVELSCGGEREIHLLGYGMDIENTKLKLFCRQKRIERFERAREMVRLLNKSSYLISEARVMELAHGVPCRPHIAQALQEAGYAYSIKEAFERFLMPGKCGYVPKKHVPVTEGIQIIRDAGGIPVLAHPMLMKKSHSVLSDLIREWAKAGLGGIEVFHPSADSGDIRALLRIADACGLLVTGGSDFHGSRGGPESEIGAALPRWTSMDSDISALLSALA